MRLAIVTTHPIQYYAPLFRLLSKEPEMEIKVFYTWSQSEKGEKYDPDFGKIIAWDIPLLDGYPYEFIKNKAKDPGVHHFNGIRNPDLIKRICEWRPDFLLVIGWNFRSHLASLRHFKGRVPVLFKGDSTLLDEKPGIKKILRRIFLKWVYHYVDYALYVGKNNHDYFLKHGMKEVRLRWVPHAIDNERFHNELSHEKEAVQWRGEMGLSESDLVLLFAGKLEPKKDPGFLLRVMNKVKDPRLKLIIAGNGILENELKNHASSNNRIFFLDFQNQQRMPLLYRLGDIFVLPSVGPGETWGLAVNEAMASNRPVIVSTQCGCAPDLVDEGKTGWLFEPGERGDQKIEKLLQKMLDDRDMLNGMGEQAWQKLQTFSYSVAVGEIKKLLQQIRLS
jgi:glycosyltransferase involved in cell wall biosynthesis